MSSTEGAEGVVARQVAAGLDDVDRRILDELRRDGRMSMRTLAEKLHISRANAYVRVQRLESTGVIRGYRAEIDPVLAGLGTSAYVTVNLDQAKWRSLVAALFVIVLVIWVPWRRSTLGRAAYAVGSSEQAAYMSGMPIRRAKFLAYVLSGLLAAMAGLFLTFFTYSGEASAANGNTYTLYSIAAVVLGGVSLFGGVGSAVGAIFGALAFRTIGDLLFVFDLDPLWQPLFQGVVLLVAVSLGAFGLLRLRNRLDLFG